MKRPAFKCYVKISGEWTSEDNAFRALRAILRSIKQLRDEFTLDVWHTVDRVYECRRDERIVRVAPA